MAWCSIQRFLRKLWAVPSPSPQQRSLCSLSPGHPSGSCCDPRLQLHPHFSSPAGRAGGRQGRPLPVLLYHPGFQASWTQISPELAVRRAEALNLVGPRGDLPSSVAHSILNCQQECPHHTVMTEAWAPSSNPLSWLGNFRQISCPR